jgi:hypothetical protein
MDECEEKRHLVVEQVRPDMGVDELRNAVKAAVEARHAASLTLSYLLRRVHEEELYKLWGYTSFTHYVQGELGLEIEYAQSLVRIERVLIEGSGRTARTGSPTRRGQGSGVSGARERGAFQA